MNNDDELYDGEEEILDIDDDSSSQDIELLDIDSSSDNDVIEYGSDIYEPFVDVYNNANDVQQIPRINRDWSTNKNTTNSNIMAQNKNSSRNLNKNNNDVANASNKDNRNNQFGMIDSPNLGNHFKNSRDLSAMSKDGHNSINSNLSKSKTPIVVSSNVKDNGEEKSKKEQLQDTALQTGVSAVAQAHGIPKPVADALASQVSVERIKKKFVKKVLISCLPLFIVILIPILVMAGDGNGSSYATSGMANEYLYGSGSTDSLYDYLISMGFCDSKDDCEDSDGAKFYKKLKEKLNNTNLTKGEADAAIVGFIGYNRSMESMFKSVDEIDYLANIFAGNGAFHVDNIDLYKDDIITVTDDSTSYFDKYRSDIAQNKTLEERTHIFNTIVKNIKSIAEVIDYDEPITGGTCSYNIDGMNPSNIKVKLLECGTSAVSYIESEELVDFETYITGVVYAESGGSSYEALKAQAVAARNYALKRGTAMGGSLGIGLKNEDGQWILSIRNCTSDQVYCDPDKGCWSDSSSADSTVHSSYMEGKAYAKGSLGEDSDIRKAVSETSGEVMIDASGKIIYTTYTSTEQNGWNSLANEGKDYFEILKSTYNEMSDIKKTCSALTGDFASWKQCGMDWSSIQIGDSGNSVCSIGCLLTSISIEIAKSGTKLNVSEFNPGVFVEHMNTIPGAFTSGGGLYWSKVSNTTLAPNFRYWGHVSLTGNKSDKAQTIKSYEDKGYYIVIKAKSNEHWVALDHVEGDNIYIFDPGSNITNIWDSPKYDVVEIALFEAS